MENVYLLPVKKDIKEKEFPIYLRQKGWRCLKFTHKNIKAIRKIIISISNKLSNFWAADLNFKFKIKGKPDFFVYKKDRYYFCEFKSKVDSLHIQQLSWMSTHINFPKMIAFVCNDKDIFKLDIEKDNTNTVITNFIKRNTKKILNEYYKKNLEE